MAYSQAEPSKQSLDRLGFVVEYIVKTETHIKQLSERVAHMDRRLDDLAAAAPAPFTAGTRAAELVDSSLRQTDSPRPPAMLQDIKADLSHNLSNALQHQQEFDTLLDTELEALRQAENMSELSILRQALVAEVERLQTAQLHLSQHLRLAHDSLEAMHSDGTQVGDELLRVWLLSLTDDLTGMPNRRAFLRRLEEEMARARRYGGILTLALIDIDFFKQINDKFGHATGDEILKYYATDVLSDLRRSDMAARIGGEEFTIILPNTGANDAAATVRKCARKIESLDVDILGQRLRVPRFSAGIAALRHDDTSADLLQRADNALYRAKQCGRGRIETE